MVGTCKHFEPRTDVRTPYNCTTRTMVKNFSSYQYRPKRAAKNKRVFSKIIMETFVIPICLEKVGGGASVGVFARPSSILLKLQVLLIIK